MAKIEIITTGIHDILLVKPLWEQLRLDHQEKSTYFSEMFTNMTFEKWMEPILEITNTGWVKIDLVKDKDTNDYIGYCISTISQHNAGEIESIFIEADYWDLGVGDRLMEKALVWMKTNHVAEVKINVAYGNEGALPFYAKYGFYPSSYLLYKK